MSNWSAWDNHNIWDKVLIQGKPSPVADKTLAIILIICVVVGLPGNAISFAFFIRRKTKNISLSLYSVITVVDCITNLLVIAVAKVLYENRDPGWFRNKHFCKFWAISYEMVTQNSLFLVMMISVTRAISIVRPQYKISRKAVMISIAVYPAEYLLERAFGAHKSIRDIYGFSPDDPICWVNSLSKYGHLIQTLLIAIKVGVPSIITFIAFVLCLNRLYSTKKAGSMDKIYRASLTVALFTLIFLLCNLPYFVGVFLFAIAVNIQHPNYPPGRKYFNFNLL